MIDIVIVSQNCSNKKGVINNLATIRMRTQESTSLCDIKFKIVFLGDMGVGKTSIIERFVKDEFEFASNSTIGIDFLSRNFTHDNQTYRLQLWDTAGQEKYKSLVPAYLRDAHCAVFVIDLTRPESLANLRVWIQLFRHHQTDSALAVLLGNKLDMEQDRKISSQQVRSYAQKEGLSYEEVSAKSGSGVNESFTMILKSLNESKEPKVANDDECFELTQRFFQKYEQLKAGHRMGCCYI